MPYDPTYPAASTPATSAPMRAQLQSNVDLIDTIPQGPQGVPGPAGTSVSGAVVDGVATVNPGEPATAGASFDGANVHFSFGIPRGAEGTPGAAGSQGLQGIQGDPGPQGPQGQMFTNFQVALTTTLDPGQPATAQTFFDGAAIQFSFGIPRGPDGLQGPAGQPGTAGATGPQGPPFTSFTVDGVTTLEPSQPATVQATFDGTFVRFAFGIPRGQPGNNGLDGMPGSPGQQGPQGAPGEVTSAQLAAAIAGTANNTNPIATLDLPISDPPTQGEMQQVLAKLNELIVGLRRA